jgi:hypothetical protein
VVRVLGILVTKVSVPCALSNFWAAAHPETLSFPNDNGAVHPPAGRVNSQGNHPSAGAINTAPACLHKSDQCECPS